MCRLREVVDGAEVWAVVKSDAYGHGSISVGRAASAAGASRLCVATIDEARILRTAMPSVPLIVLSPLAPGEEQSVAEIGCAVTVSTGEGWERLRDRHDVDVHVKVDTGMGRWGLSPEAALAAGAEIAGGPRPERLAGLMSHLATADQEDRDFVDRQAELFRSVSAAFPPCPRHLANSAATLRYPDLHFDAVRPGIAVYGIDPLGIAGSAHGLTPAMRWTSRVDSIRQLAAGDSTGYGRRFIADRDCRVALVPIGYADGYPRHLSGLGEVLLGGCRCRVVATVSMGQFAVLLPHDLVAAAGDEVALLGADGDDRILAEELARHVGTIPYEIVCGVRDSRDRARREQVQ